MARWCRRNGITTVLLPAFHCETMAVPFWLEAMAVRTTPVDEQLRTDPGALARIVADLTAPTALLVCRVGGVDAAVGLPEVLEQARAAGHLVIEDATHSLLDDLLVDDTVGHTPLLPADIRLASLRKLLPVPEGAWIVTCPSAELGEPAARSAAAGRLTGTGLALLEALRRWDQLPDLPAASAPVPAGAAPLLAAVQEADDALDAALSPSPVHARTLAMLADLDPLLCARRWRDANTRLCALLTPTVRALNPGRACFPVLRHRLASRIDEAMGARGSFAPLYWPRPAWLADDVGWPEDVVSIDVRPGQPPARAAQLAGIIAAATTLA